MELIGLSFLIVGFAVVGYVYAIVIRTGILQSCVMLTLNT